MRKSEFCNMCENKVSDQLFSNCTTDQCPCFCYMHKKILQSCDMLPRILMMKCEYEKDFQTFAQHGCQNWRKSYIPKKKKKDSD